MTRRQRLDARRLVGAWVLAVAVLIAVAPAARAYCPFATIYLPPDQPYTWGQPDIIQTIQPGAPYWIVLGVQMVDPTDDDDVDMYSTAAPDFDTPPCVTGHLASSTNFAGRTDFIVGDFNFNPYADYYAPITCYTGHCDYNYNRGDVIWRSGDLLTVDAAATTVNVTTASSDPNTIVKIWDVYLNAGTTYYFNFQSTGDRQPKLLLFRNPAGGVYWAGRNAAEFEIASGCRTYSAPTTGYYGLVVVSDRYSSLASTFTAGVFTFPVCSCPSVLLPNSPQLVAAGETGAYDLVAQPTNYWEAIAVRSPSDWDLRVGSTADPDLGCFTSTLATSALSPPRTDVVAGDFNYSLALPETVSVKSSRFSGADGATIELDQGQNTLYDNGARASGTLYSNDIVRIWDVPLTLGTTYTFTVGTAGADEKMLLFGNFTNGVLWRGRGLTLFESSSTANFTPTWSGYYGLAVIKDDANVGGFSVGFGECAQPASLPDKTDVLSSSGGINYWSFNQSAGSWTALSVFSSDADFDLRQYDQSSGSTWPDCFGSPGALSNSSSVMDFVVGDFHFNPAGTQYVRTYQYTNDVFAGCHVQRDAGSGTLQVNAAMPLTVNWTAIDPYQDHLRCYDVYLYGGIPYNFEFSQSAGSGAHLLLFANPTNGVYWAPRSAAQFDVMANHAYTPPQNGWYGVVVANDAAFLGSFTLRVSSLVLSASDPQSPASDALRGIAPNPTHGLTRIGFDLASAAAPSFDVLDMQGRLVSRLDPGEFRAGRWDVPISFSDSRGRTLSAGIYFVRMHVGDRTVATRKVTVVP